MAGSGMIAVKITVQTPPGAVVGAVLPSSFESIPMGMLVGMVETTVNCPVLGVVIGMPVVCAVGKGRRHRSGQHQCGRS